MSLRFIRQCTTESLHGQLVEALVMPYLHYCCVVCLDASNKQKIRLQRLNNSCVRYIDGARRDEHITANRRDLGWLRTDSRRIYFAAILIDKILRIGEPVYLAAFFQKYRSRGPVTGSIKELYSACAHYYRVESFSCSRHAVVQLAPHNHTQPTISRQIESSCLRPPICPGLLVAEIILIKCTSKITILLSILFYFIFNFINFYCYLVKDDLFTKTPQIVAIDRQQIKRKTYKSRLTK